MSYSHAACALVLVASAAGAQQPADSNASKSLPVMTLPGTAPECTGASALSFERREQPSTRGSVVGRSDAAGDTLCVSRSLAVAIAVRANPQLEIAGAQVREARASGVAGASVADPVFSMEWDQSPGPVGLGGNNGRVVGASLSIPFFDKFRLQRKIGAAGVRESEYDSAAVRLGVRAGAAASYDTLLASLRHRGDLLQADSLARDFATRTRAQFAAGNVPRLDVVNADVAVAQIGTQLIAAERDIATARAALNRWLGRPLGAPIRTADSLAMPPPIPDLAELEPMALVHRPELASLGAQRRGAHAATALAREFWLPDFSVAVSRDFADPGPGLITTGISLPIPLWYWNHSRGDIAQNTAREAELDATIRDARAAVQQDVRTAWTTAAAAYRQAVYLHDQLLPAALESYRIAASSYALGGLSALEVNTARSALVDAEAQYTDALAAAQIARTVLERMIAMPLDPIPPPSPPPSA